MKRLLLILAILLLAGNSVFLRSSEKCRLRKTAFPAAQAVPPSAASAVIPSVATAVIPSVASLVISSESSESRNLERIDAVLERYLEGIERASLGEKMGECDFLIGACADSLMRQHVGIRLYDHYVTSALMGDEAVAIYLYDNWFAPRRIAFESEIDLLNAGIFADFNRHSLIGMEAPAVTLQDRAGEPVALPVKGEYSVVYFYDTECSRCRLESALLRMLLSSGQFPLTFCAVYTGDNREAWERYAEESLAIDSAAVEVRHLWDPSLDSDFQRLYGVLQTPRLFLLAPDGRILGRQLNAEALLDLLKIYYGK